MFQIFVLGDAISLEGDNLVTFRFASHNLPNTCAVCCISPLRSCFIVLLVVPKNRRLLLLSEDRSVRMSFIVKACSIRSI